MVRNQEVRGDPQAVEGEDHQDFHTKDPILPWDTDTELEGKASSPTCGRCRRVFPDDLNETDFIEKASEKGHRHDTDRAEPPRELKDHRKDETSRHAPRGAWHTQL
ncbi:hypothetical protein NDU88_005868 [Pleurodeles waltl]|uniref:Uncharacterized protein n=1 Tax=Pleurodeles waltl TaxID=8319 RepID=A0AAV7WEL1_PLEWA|nr:hypothetical protein NDU88_005868 [Pleurodeles waltl]